MIPIASENAAFTDTRFGTSDDLLERLEELFLRVLGDADARVADGDLERVHRNSGGRNAAEWSFPTYRFSPPILSHIQFFPDGLE